MNQVNLSELIGKLPEAMRSNAEAYLKGLIGMADADMESFLSFLAYGAQSEAWALVKKNVPASVLLEAHEKYVESLEQQVDAAEALERSRNGVITDMLRIALGVLRISNYVVY
jgi:hypothetical protein